MNLDNSLYQRAISFTNKFGKPEGFSVHEGSSTTDNIIIKQNNTIIALLLEINNKIEQILKDKTIEQNKQPSIDELITKLNKIEITPQKERIVKKPQKWTFFQIGEEPSKKKDLDQATQKTK